VSLSRGAHRRCVVALLVLGLAGCAGRPLAEQAAAGVTPMDPMRLEQLFAARGGAIEGPAGAVRTQIDGVDVYLISETRRDRMRLIVRIAPVARLDPRLLPVLLEANFDRTLEARYAIAEGDLFAVFMHPISSLTPALLDSSIDQVLSLRRTFGTTYSGGAAR
jgi:hypothetical protein